MYWKEIAEENSLCMHPGQLVLRHTGRTHEDGTYVQTGMKRNGTSNMVQWFIVWLVTEFEPGPKPCSLELSLASAVTYYWHLNIREIYLREALLKKKMFSFGHCPKRGGGEGLAQIF